MEWKELKIYTSHEGIDTLSNALIMNGIDGFVINDPEDVKEFERNKKSSWDYIGEEVYELVCKGTFITVYISDDESGTSQLEAVLNAVQLLKSSNITGAYGELNISCESVKEEDWANSWKQYFKPLNVGERLIIKPSWETLPEDNKRIVLEIDPETSFGTGRHHTTRLCLELLEKYIKPGDTVCDIGCGSGIISIAAMLYGAKNAVAVDISPDAEKISRENAAKNGIPSNKYISYCGDVVTDEALRRKIGKGYTLVAANIVADVLLSMKEVFAEITASGGTLVLSGIIDGRFEEVTEVVKLNGFTLVESCNCEMWNAAVFVKS